MRKAAFFDRDGVINKDYGYVGQISRFDFERGVVEALSYLRQQGFLLVLVTNQSGIARGFYTEADFLKVTCFMQYCLSLHDAQFDEVYCCPHHPEAKLIKYRKDCNCRKPNPGMFFKAQQDLDLDLKSCLMFGDHLSDLKAAKAAGVEHLFLIGDRSEENVFPKVICAPSLYQAVIGGFVR